MSAMIKVPEISLGLLLMLMLMQSISGQSESPMQQQFLQLDNILSDRINNVLQQLKSQANISEELQQLYERLEHASAMPLTQLDEKIMIYNAYQAYDNVEQPLQETSSNKPSADKDDTDYEGDYDNEYEEDYEEEDFSIDFSLEGRKRARPYSAFEKRIIRLLKRLGVYEYDSFTERVFKAIFSDEKQLKKLKKKLDELDDKDDEAECCLWDFIFGLF